MAVPKTKATLLKRLEAFLQEKKTGDRGGWPEVTSDESNDLYEIVRAIIDLKYERDSDNCTPVEFQLLDRTRFEPMHFLPVPYDRPGANLADCYRAVLGNVAIAASHMQRYLDIARHHQVLAQEHERNRAISNPRR